MPGTEVTTGQPVVPGKTRGDGGAIRRAGHDSDGADDGAGHSVISRHTGDRLSETPRSVEEPLVAPRGSLEPLIMPKLPKLEIAKYDGNPIR